MSADFKLNNFKLAISTKCKSLLIHHHVNRFLFNLRNVFQSFLIDDSFGR